MQGTVKWFSIGKGYGYIIGSDGKENFVHHSSIQMDGFRYLNTDDIVYFEIGNGTTGRKQAVNVTPILTMQMIEKALKDEGLRVKQIIDQYGLKQYIVINSDDMMQSPEYGMSLVESAAFAGIDVEGLE